VHRVSNPPHLGLSRHRSHLFGPKKGGAKGSGQAVHGPRPWAAWRSIHGGSKCSQGRQNHVRRRGPIQGCCGAQSRCWASLTAPVVEASGSVVALQHLNSQLQQSARQGHGTAALLST